MRVLSGVSRRVESEDGVVLHERWWPVREPRAVLVFVHGIASHGGWFAGTAEHLVDAGVAVLAPDRRGSGLSDGPRGHLPSFERALADLDAAVQRARRDHSGLPVVLGASSWAAKLAIVYAAASRGVLAGLALLGPGLFPTVRLPAARRAQVVVTHRLAARAPIPIPLTPEHYTANPAYLEFVRADPLRLHTATSRFFWETARLDRRRAVDSARLRLPLLVLQGESDAMMSTCRTRDWFAGLELSDKLYRSYPGAGHTLDFEVDRCTYLDDLRGWLCRR